MSEQQRERAELLAALHAAGAASEEDEQELEALLQADSSLREVVRDFQDSIMALASSFEPLETSPKTLRRIKRKIAREKGGLLDRVRSWFSKP
jgi:anti-sigma-K factor RskA